jgi:hypothetical protein
MQYELRTAALNDDGAPWRTKMLKNFEYAATVATAFAAHLLVLSTAILV